MPAPTKREWIGAFMDGLERSQYTGAVDLCLRYDRGGIARVMPRTCGGALGQPCDRGGVREIHPRDNGSMGTVPRLAAHLTDITERLARLVTVVDLMEHGQPVDLANLRAALERAHAHASGLLEEVRAAETNDLTERMRGTPRRDGASA